MADASPDASGNREDVAAPSKRARESGPVGDFVQIYSMGEWQIEGHTATGIRRPFICKDQVYIFSRYFCLFVNFLVNEY